MVSFWILQPILFYIIHILYTDYTPYIIFTTQKLYATAKKYCFFLESA